MNHSKLMVLCKKCCKEITKEEAIWKKKAPIWYHDYKGWGFYAGYFCKKCARQTDRSSKFLWIYFSFFFGFWLGSIITAFLLLKLKSN